MQHMLSVSFCIQRQQRLNVKKEAPIIIRLKLHSKTRDISSGLRVRPNQWGSKFGAVKGTGESAEQTNKVLNTSKAWLLNIFTQLNYAGNPSLDDPLNEFNGKRQSRGYYLLQLVTEHNDHIKKRVGIDYTESTFEKYQAMELRITQYVKETLEKKTFP